MMMPELPEDLLEEILCRSFTYRGIRTEARLAPRLEAGSLSGRPSPTLSVFPGGPRGPGENLGGQRESNCGHHIGITPSSTTSPTHVGFCHTYYGLLLCVCDNNEVESTSLVVWNPCTGQTKWIQHRKLCYICTYALGSYQDNKSGNKSYKILSRRFYGHQDPEFEIYEINSNSWRRILDVNVDCTDMYIRNVSLKGKTYWFATDEKEKQLGLFLISFDHTTERFERLCLPYPHPYHEIWVTNKIGETKVLSWIKVLAVDLTPEPKFDMLLLVDVEKKVLVYTQNNGYKSQTMVYIVGEDNKVREVAFGDAFKPFLLNYVPSLTQIQQGDD
ncbi:unnamed protein product [Arabidopsis lyrata]|nr:unnamed protein product [Arabidopsis lyrata]